MIQGLVRWLLCLFGIHDCETIDRVTPPVPLPPPFPGGTRLRYRLRICRLCGRMVRIEQYPAGPEPRTETDRR